MAEKVVIFEADINAEEAVKEIQQLKQRVSELKDKTDDLKKTQGETSEEYIRAKAEYKATQDELKKTENLTKKLISAQKEGVGTIPMLEAETAKLRAEQKKLNLETEAGIQRNTEINEKINQNTEFIKANSDQRVKDIMSVGHYEDATKNLKLELRENTIALAKMKAAGQDNTEAYQELLKITGELKDTIDDTREEIKKYASDTQALDQAIGIFKGIGAAAQLAEGASALLGEENEDLTKSIQKMVAIQSVLNALQEIGNSLQKESAFMMGVNSVKTKSAAAAQAVYAASVGTSTGAMKLFRTALLATGIGAIVVGLVLLITNWDKLTSAINKSAKEAQRYAEEMENVRKVNELNAGLDNLALEISKERGAASNELIKIELQNNKKRQAAINKELDLLTELGKLRNKTDEENQRFQELTNELIEKGDEAILLRLRLEKQLSEEQKKLAEEQKKLADENAKRIKAENEKRIEKEKELAENLTKYYEKDLNDREKRRIEFDNNLLKDRAENAIEELDIAIEAVKLEIEKEEELRKEASELAKERRFYDLENKLELAKYDIDQTIELEQQKNMMLWEEEIAYANKIGADVTLVNEKYRRADLELERAKVNAKLAIAESFAGQVAELFGEQTKLGRIAASAQTLINTYLGAQAAFAQTPGGIAIKSAAAALATAIGLKNVQKIWSVKSGLKGDKSSGSASISAGGGVSAPRTTSAPTVGQGIVARNTAQAVDANNVSLQPTLVTDQVTVNQRSDMAKNKTAVA